jgi:hypothetical protein
MKRYLTIAACTLLAATALFAQSPAKSTSKQAGLGKATAASNEEANIRAYIELLRTDLKKSKAGVMGEVMHGARKSDRGVD